MNYQILGIFNPETDERKIAGVTFSTKEVMQPDDIENEHIYFTEAEMAHIASLPEDQRNAYALSLAENKRNK